MLPDGVEQYDPTEQDEIIDTFADMLRFATRDGGRKRAAGEKPSWKVDPSHEAALFSHLSKWKHGELWDADSGAHPLVHLAWRALAIAWQEWADLRDETPIGTSSSAPATSEGPR